ncbi:MAG: hypothetical protein J0I20_12000 [Chloroflexi bacterium]|nr:hypothetical protein [Chloroflexota bacterium]
MTMKKQPTIFQILKDMLGWGWFLALVEIFIGFAVFNPNDGLANLGNALHYAEINAGRIGGTPFGTYIGPTLPNYQDQLFTLKLPIYLNAITLFLFISGLFLVGFGFLVYCYRLKYPIAKALDNRS